MKNIIKMMSVLLAIFFVSACAKDEIDQLALTDFPPGVLKTYPSVSIPKSKGAFDITVWFSDGSTSPLANGKVTLVNSAGATLATGEKALTGTLDSVVISGSTFNSANLPIDTYTMKISVTDSKGQTTNQDVNFKVSLLPYLANHNEMYLRGGFNAWGTTAMTLIADNLWEAKGVDFNGGEWKIANTNNWSDKDWGDTNCDGIMASPSDNTNCNYKGLVNIRFNDKTLQYTLVPTVQYDTKLASLFFLGTINKFDGDQYPFRLTANNTWVLDEVLLMPGDKFKFSEGKHFTGTNFGASSDAGVAQKFGPNIMYMETYGGYYKITFNEKTLAYSLQLVRGLVPQNLFIVGSVNGWSPENALPMRTVKDGTGRVLYYEGYFYLPTDGAVKFIDKKAVWGELTYNLGFDGQNNDNGKLINSGGSSNVEPRDANGRIAGFFYFKVDLYNNTYKYERMNWGLIGGFTEWQNEEPLTYNTTSNRFERSITTASGGAVKFRSKNTGVAFNAGDWAFNVGSEFTAWDDSGSDLNLPAGTRNVSLAIDTEGKCVVTGF